MSGCCKQHVKPLRLVNFELNCLFLPFYLFLLTFIALFVVGVHSFSRPFKWHILMVCMLFIVHIWFKCANQFEIIVVKSLRVKGLQKGDNCTIFVACSDTFIKFFFIRVFDFCAYRSITYAVEHHKQRQIGLTSIHIPVSPPIIKYLSIAIRVDCWQDTWWSQY